MRIFGKVLGLFLLVGSVLGMSTAATAGSYCTASGRGELYRCGFPDKESAAYWGYYNSTLANQGNIQRDIYSYGGVVYYKHAADGAPPANGPTNYWWGYYVADRLAEQQTPRGPFHYYAIYYSNAPVVTAIKPPKNAGLPFCPVNKNTPKRNSNILIAGIGNPINPGTGNKYQEETDYTGQGLFPLVFDRVYNSILGTPTETTAVGAHWRHYYHRKVQIISSTAATVSRHDGKDYDFTLLDSVWMPDADITDTLAKLTDATGNLSGWQYTTADNAIETYDAAGQLILSLPTPQA